MSAAAPAKKAAVHAPHGLGDFLTTPRLIPLCLLAIGIGAISAVVAMVLLRLLVIGLMARHEEQHREHVLRVHRLVPARARSLLSVSRRE